MPRNMSFAMTTQQVRDRTKDVTRRDGWWFLKPGDVVNAVEKSMGLPKGAKVKRLCQIEIISTRPEPLNMISQDDVDREGFPEWTPEDFILFLTSKSGCKPDKTLNRIEFRYLD